jgi:hypothetical protein
MAGFDGRFHFGIVGWNLIGAKVFAFAMIGISGWAKAAPTVGLSKIRWSKDQDYLPDNLRVSILSQVRGWKQEEKWGTEGAGSILGIRLR